MSTVPACRWRRELIAHDRCVCVSPKVVSGPNGIPLAVCAQCRYANHAPPPRPGGLCRHLGRRVGLQTCGPCGQREGHPVEVPAHDCAIHRRCTIGVRVEGVACCDGCPDRQPPWMEPAAGDVRHLMYHLCPQGDVWRWNIEQLKRRLSLFNGERLIAVATDKGTSPISEVIEAVQGWDCTVEGFDNDRTLRERQTHLWLLRELSHYRGPRDVSFYGHGKGVSTRAVYPGVARWTEEMYSANLDYWPIVRGLLRDHACVGCYRRRGTGLPHHNVNWHFSGSFRWTRNRDLYSRQWERLGAGYCASEGYPALQFELQETACIHSEFGRAGMGLYLAETWEAWAAAAADQFHIQYGEYRQAPLLFTVILTAHRQPQLVHDAIRSVLSQTCPDWQLLIVDSGEIAATGAYDRYKDDARVSVMTTGETPEMRAGMCIQGWAINEAWRRGRVRGDLVLHLSDDDALAPPVVSRMIATARAHPDQGAWYGRARRERVHPGGLTQQLGYLNTVGVGRPSNTLRCRVDGMQVVHRREQHVEWTEKRELAHHADGWWIDALSARTPIHPVEDVIGVHRHTPLSAFTQ